MTTRAASIGAAVALSGLGLALVAIAGRGAVADAEPDIAPGVYRVEVPDPTVEVVEVSYQDASLHPVLDPRRLQVLRHSEELGGARVRWEGDVTPTAAGFVPVPRRLVLSREPGFREEFRVSYRDEPPVSVLEYLDDLLARGFHLEEAG